MPRKLQNANNTKETQEPEKPKNQGPRNNDRRRGNRRPRREDKTQVAANEAAPVENKVEASAESEKGGN